ncbi:MAG: hypothetical protein H7Y22_11770 [Gemmatimonadaceae bacterium]|nr:hypothetical protein [Gloeobacterales cyanobacterium ES-bin-141]
MDRRLSGSLALTLVGSTLLAPQLPALSQTLQGGDVVAANVDLAGSSRRIPSSFAGFSIEFSSLLSFTGRTSTTVNPSFTQLLKNLGQYNNGLPLIRIGGNTAEKVWFNPDGQPLPPGITYNITPTYLAAVGASFSQSGANLMMGLNLAKNDPTYAIDLARAAVSYIPAERIFSFQMGNEANIFPYKTYYTDPATGQAVLMRPSDWTFAEYIGEFDTHKNALRSAVASGLPLSGPVFSGGQKDDGRWKKYMGEFMAAEGADINSVSYHGYPYTACPDDPAAIPTIADVLSEKASHDFAQGFAPIVAAASAHGKQVRISETNSMTCGGVDGVSNTLAAALWATDMMFEAANVGAGGVNIISGSQPHMSPMYFDGHIDY